MLRKAAIDRFVCPCSRPVLPEVDSLAGIDRFVCPCSRPVLPEVDSLAGYEGGQKMPTIRLDSTRLESLELINSFALVVDEDDSTHRKSGRE